VLYSWGLKNNIDFIAASFIRKPSDVIEIQKFCAEQIQALQLPRSVPLIISKIESTEGLENFVDILKVSDAIMIARGDLAVEIPMETLTAVQKEIIRQCNHLGKPVIVATQMLESMQKNPRPTRAEVTDVANAVVDGADCVMLSGESAKGKYPVESVAMMRRIIQETELNLQAKSLQFIPPHQQTSSTNDAFVKSLRNTPVAQQVASIYQSIVAKDPLSFNGVVLQLNSEETNVQVSQLLSKTKLLLPIFLPVSSYKTARLLSLYQGVYPLVAKHDITNEHFVDQITQRFGRDSFQNKFNKQKKKFVVVRESGNNLSYEVL
jgi:pyruvate kinase